jgi:hypothetical protein
MKRILPSTLAVLSLVLPATASASTGPESITTTIPITSFPSSPPHKQTYPSTYTAAGTYDDSGSVTVEALFAAVPSPSVGVLQTRRTYTSDDGHGTLVLRCTQITTPADTVSYPAVTNTGSCALTAAIGDFAGLFPSGAISGTTYFNSTGSAATLIDTTVLGG